MTTCSVSWGKLYQTVVKLSKLIWFNSVSISSTQWYIKLLLKFPKNHFFCKKLKIHHKTCIPHPILSELFGVFIKKSIFYINHGKNAFSLTNILKAAQRTHTSNMPCSPLLTWGTKDRRSWNTDLGLANHGASATPSVVLSVSKANSTESCLSAQF